MRLHSWFSSLYRTAAIARIGLPSADYVLDAAELEYGCRAGSSASPAMSSTTASLTMTWAKRWRPPGASDWVR